jgi:hypothetical protein
VGAVGAGHDGGCAGFGLPPPCSGLYGAGLPREAALAEEKPRVARPALMRCSFARSHEYECRAAGGGAWSACIAALQVTQGRTSQAWSCQPGWSRAAQQQDVIQEMQRARGRPIRPVTERDKATLEAHVLRVRDSTPPGGRVRQSFGVTTQHTITDNVHKHVQY